MSRRLWVMADFKKTFDFSECSKNSIKAMNFLRFLGGRGSG